MTLKKAIICDLDGTLALCDQRNPYNTAQADRDKLNYAIAELLSRYGTTHTLFLVTGREDKYRELTEKWLQRHGVSYHFLFMRPEKDRRKDIVVKEEVYNLHIKGQYEVDFVLEDRTQVVQMYRGLGLLVFQVAEGNY